jgi:uncharacterized protein GlcG (DUF336 family)
MDARGGCLLSSVITLEEARTVVRVALERARELDCAPMTVAVLDAGGHTVALEREDDSGVLRAEIAFAKAFGSVGLGLSSRAIGMRGERYPAFVASLPAVSAGRVVPVPGGVLIRRDGRIVGAVGISGDLPDRDEDCAVAGIRAAGLDADTGADGH